MNDGALDVAAADSAGGFLRWRRHHAAPPGTPCYNCGTVLKGPWCYQCGQLGEDFHRSAHHLLAEAFESFFHADGRLWKTLPGLLLRPGHLTSSYLHGKRAPQIPPMRLFLVVLLLLFIAGDLAMSHGHVLLLHVDPKDRGDLDKMQVHLFPAYDTALTNWLKIHLGRAFDHPQALIDAMGNWAHRFAFMTLPISALILSAIFIFRRGVVLFDHLIFSMHSLSFLGLMTTLALLGDTYGFPAASWLLALTPAHLFVHMRGTYNTGIFFTLIRMWVLFLASSVAFALMMAGLVLIGLNALQS